MIEDAQRDQPKSSAFKSIMTQGVVLVAGVGLGYGFLMWQQQQQKVAELTEMVLQMQQSVPDVATRNAPLDLVSVTPEPSVAVKAPVETPAPAAAVVSAAVVVEEAANEQPAAPETTATKIQNLVAAASGDIAPSKAETDARRIETLAIVAAGVQELVDAVVAGDYDIHTNYEDEHFSGRIHFAFVGHEEDQTELEQFIAAAAERGILATSSAAIDGDGKVNGHILLFNLVERALENGTQEEQRAGQKMRQAAIAMLAEDEVVGANAAAANAEGDRYYVVEPGDSLAYIALQVYGNTNSYERIFNANRNVLNTPDRINVGQRLLIPGA